MKNLIDLTGNTILVAGASSGIGRQTAITLSEAGAKVILTARREEQLKETLKLLSGSGHGIAAFDLKRIDEIEKFVHGVVEEHGLLQGFVFSAGIVDVRPYKISTPEVMKELMEVNFFAFYEMVRQFAKKKYSQEGAKIVAVSSVASVRPGKGQAAYAASKAAIDAAILVLAQELIARHININSVRPGVVRTPSSENYLTDEAYDIRMQPLGIIEAEDVADMIAYLLSSAADMITGSWFDVGGGRLCRE